MTGSRWRIAALMPVVVVLGFVVLTGWGHRSYNAYRAIEFLNAQPGGLDDAVDRARLLLAATRSAPWDGDLWRARARFAFRLTAVDPDWVRAVLAAWGRDPGSGADPILAMLEEAERNYAIASRRNALDGESRFWSVVVEAARDRRLGLNVVAEADAYLARIDDALLLDPQRPDRRMDAGRLALSLGRPERAADYIASALAINADELEAAVDLLMYTSLGAGGAAAVVPDKSNPQQRLAAVLFERWRFPEAEAAWRRYRELAGLRVVENAPEVAVVNGGFDDALGTHFHDWRVVEVDGVKVGVEDGALVARFHNGPANYFHVTQDVPIPAPGLWRFTATLAAEGFNPDTIVGVEAVHPLSPDLLSAGDVCYVSAAPDGEVAKTARGGSVRLETLVEIPGELPVIRLRLRRHSAPGEADSGVGVLSLDDVALLRVEDAEPALLQTEEGTADADGVDHHSD